MQGRIRNVLDMKPPGILGLVEEAAGIRMFNERKDDALRVIEKKQRQFDEVNRIIEEELTDNVERLRAERDLYNRWASLKADVERRQRRTGVKRHHANSFNSQLDGN
jgi:structural maintenance of chromosome 2